MMADGWHWMRPWWLTALLLLPLLWWMWRREGAGRGGDWARVCDPHLLPHLLRASASAGEGRRFPFLLALALLLAVLALAGPVWRKLPQPLFRAETTMIVLLDLSLSMDAGDVKPSRLERAKLKIADLLGKRKEGTTALIVFAGDAFPVTPPTTDIQTINAQLHALTTDIMPVLGSRPDRALALAGKMFARTDPLARGVVVLITDAEVAPDALEQASALRRQGHRLLVLGVGTPEGAPIPLRKGGFVRDGQGGIVIPRLEEEPLRQLAASGGGGYARMEGDDRDLDALLALARARPDDPVKATTLAADLWQEEGPWLLLPLLPLAAWGFRRGCLVVLFCLVGVRPAEAVDWGALWQTPDQSGAERLAAGDAEGAASRFVDPAWKGVALYRAGRYEESLAAMSGLESADAWYNRGNALARLDRLPEAARAYEEALKRQPGHEDARHNLEQVKKRQESPPPPQQSQSGKEPEQQTNEISRKEEKPTAQERAESGEAKQEEKQEAKQEEKQEEKQEAKQEEKQEAKQEEKELAQQQWLRRIPDDPGGLLRRKFLYQYQQRQTPSRQETNAW
ncbi:MAG: VWA domain-containing protein [Magnetococcales bacterium]|nr:VWA domain-containing protein [Magnetococcales bacterium]